MTELSRCVAFFGKERIHKKIRRRNGKFVVWTCNSTVCEMMIFFQCHAIKSNDIIRQVSQGARNLSSPRDRAHICLGAAGHKDRILENRR